MALAATLSHIYFTCRGALELAQSTMRVGLYTDINRSASYSNLRPAPDICPRRAGHERRSRVDVGDKFWDEYSRTTSAVAEIQDYSTEI